MLSLSSGVPEVASSLRAVTRGSNPCLGYQTRITIDIAALLRLSAIKWLALPTPDALELDDDPVG